MVSRKTLTEHRGSLGQDSLLATSRDTARAWAVKSRFCGSVVLSVRRTIRRVRGRSLLVIAWLKGAVPRARSWVPR